MYVLVVVFVTEEVAGTDKRTSLQYCSNNFTVKCFIEHTSGLSFKVEVADVDKH